MIDAHFLAGKKGPVFIDGSGLIDGGNWFGETVRPAKNYGELNLDNLNSAMQAYKNVLGLLLNCNREFYFPAGVTGEMQALSNNLEVYIGLFEKRRAPILSEHAAARRKAIRCIKVWYDSILAIGKDNAYVLPDSARYTALQKLIVELSQENHLKDKPHWPKDKIEEERKRASQVDEQIVTCALAHCAEYRVKCGIVTGDSDIRKIMHFSLDYMLKNRQFLNVAKAVRASPISICQTFRNPPLYYNTSEAFRKR